MKNNQLALKRNEHLSSSFEKKKKTTHEKQGIYGGDEDWFMLIEYW